MTSGASPVIELPPSVRLHQLMAGHWISQAIYVAAKLGIADRLADVLRKLLDLEMLVCFGGRERTEAEYRDLLGAAGFELLRVVSTEAPASVIDARPA